MTVHLEMDTDGTVWFDEPRYRVWHVSSTDNPVSVEPWRVVRGCLPGTWSVSTDYLESDSGLNKIVESFNQMYRVDGPTHESAFGPVIREFPGVRTRYTKLVWERRTSWGGRITDMVLVHEIPED